jgi:hypothetical protein
MADSKVIPAAGLGVGILFLWSAVRGKSVLSAAQQAIRGKNPQGATPDAKVTGDNIGSAASAAYTGTAVTPANGSEKAWITALLLTIGAPPTSANIRSMTAWISNEGPWGTQGENGNNPLNTSITNSPGYLGKWPAAPVVSIFATLTDGVAATAATLLSGNYSDVVGALRSGQGLCGRSFAGLSEWSSGGYSSVC